MKYYLIIVAGLLLTTCASSNVTQHNGSFEDLVKAGADVIIKDQTFNRDIDFTQFEKTMISEGIHQVRIVSAVTFLNCTFNGKVIAYSKDGDYNTSITSFQSSLSFIGCTFNNEVNFKASSVLGRTDFTKTAFFETANFEECTFFQNAYFRASTYHKEARFHNAVFMQKANFMNTEFDEVLSFQYAKFNGEAQFSSCKFMGYTDFGNISCFGNYYSNFAEFADRSVFNNSFFYRRTDMNNVSFNRCEMKNCKFFGETRMAESTAKDQLFLDNSFFLLGNPDFSSFDKTTISIN